jgi:hypothetical protein
MREKRNAIQLFPISNILTASSSLSKCSGNWKEKSNILKEQKLTRKSVVIYDLCHEKEQQHIFVPVAVKQSVQ